MGTQVGFGPLESIDGPLPLPPRYGLVQAAQTPAAGVTLIGTDVDAGGVPRWINGVALYPYPPDPGYVYDTCATGSDAETKGFGEDAGQPEFGAMTVVLDETCTSSRVWDQDRFKQRAVTAFQAIESAAVAREFATGEKLFLQPHLADGNGVFPAADTAVSVIYGLALLEQAIAASHRFGVIHCSPRVATIARDRFAIDDRDGVLRTINGLVVIPDFGYTQWIDESGTLTYQAGFTPEGHAAPADASQEWMYATGPIDIRRDNLFVTPETVAEAMDRGSGGATMGRPNSITYRVERYYLVDWDTQVQASVLVDLDT